MTAPKLSKPLHIAIVMDGNGRWASKRFLPRIAGHKQGVDTLKKIVHACPPRGVTALTVFAFSSENWNRPTDEVTGLMDILALAIAREVPNLRKEGVQIRFLGERANLSLRVKKGLEEAEAATVSNTSLILNVCFNYGGRWDIASAAARLAANGTEITEESLSNELALTHCGDPDLIIRTGNEKRLSNFLLWQAAYAELYFTDLLWPDFDESALDAALHEFASRQRRFGKTPDQVADRSAKTVERQAPC